MAERQANPSRVEGAFHPLVLTLMILSVLWLVALAWLLFSTNRVGTFMMVVVTFTALGFLAVPVVFWLLAGERGPRGERVPFRIWARRHFALPEGPVAAREAAINALIAPLAAAITLTFTGLAAWMAAKGLI